MIHRSLWRRWRGAFAATVANSGALKRQLEESGIAPVEVIWNGVPEVPTRPPLAGQPTIAFAGRLAREKGADVLVRAFAGVAAETPDARLIIVGDGPERGRLTRQIAALGLASRVTLTGHLSAGDMERVLRPAWVQAMPSRFETFGSVAAEAMMRGTAVVASRVGGLCEIVQDGRSGILVPPGDDAALAAALLGIIRNRDAAERMGREGRAFAMANLRVETAADRMLQLYSRLIAARGDKPCRVR